MTFLVVVVVVVVAQDGDGGEGKSHSDAAQDLSDVPYVEMGEGMVMTTARPMQHFPLIYERW